MFKHLPPPPSDQGVAILGQPYTAVDWYPTLTIMHNCDPKTPVTLVLGRPTVCSGCQQVCVLQAYRIHPNGSVEWAVGFATQKPTEGSPIVN